MEIAGVALTWPGGARLAVWVCPNIEHYEYLPRQINTRDPWPRMPHPDVLGYGGAATQLQTAVSEASGENADVAYSMLGVAFNLAIFGAGILGALLLIAELLGPLTLGRQCQRRYLTRATQCIGEGHSAADHDDHEGDDQHAGTHARIHRRDRRGEHPCECRQREPAPAQPGRRALSASQSVRLIGTRSRPGPS